MSKPFAVFDIDGTLFRSSLIIEFMKVAVENGIFPKSSRENYFEQYSAWKQRAHKNAYEEYIDGVVTTFLENIAGKDKGEVARIGELIAQQKHLETYVYTRKLVQKLSDTHFVIAISGSNVEFLEPFVKNYGFDHWYGSELEIVDDKYTGGEVRIGHHNKDITLKRIIDKENLEYEGSIAVGDTAPDIPMLELAQTAIAFNPSRELFEHARKANWKIVVERKNMIYHLGNKNGEYLLENE